MAYEKDDPDTREQAKEIIEGDEYRATIKLANAAFDRVQKRAGKNFDDWLIVGEGFAQIRHAAYVLSGTNDNQSPVYKRQFSALVGRTKLGDVDAVTRSKLLDMVTHRPDVELWWASLTKAQQTRWSHPTTIWKAWKNATKPPRSSSFPDPKQGKGPKAELVDATPDELGQLFSRSGPLATVRITADAKANVEAILKVTDGLAIDAGQRARLLRDMSAGLEAALDRDEPEDS